MSSKFRPKRKPGRKELLYFLATFFLFLEFSQAFSGATLVYAAGTVGTGTAASCTEAALDAKLAGGGNIDFSCGPNPVTITVSKQKTLSANTSLDGGGLITISGGGKVRIFYTQNNVVFSVKNLTIANGYATNNDSGELLGDGAGILSGYRSSLTVTNCKFINNVSTKPGGDDGGGAIYIKSESVLRVDKTEFIGNSSSGSGAAIHNLLSNLTVTNSTFSNNRAGDSGPGIYVDGVKGANGFVIINNSSFTGNTGTGQGGAIFTFLYSYNPPDVFPYQPGSYVSIDNTTFAANQVVTRADGDSLGGALRHGNGPLTLTNSVFYDNLAFQQGAAIWLGEKAYPTNISNVTIASNRAVSADGKSGLGGGLLIASTGPINLTNTTIAGNYAGFQGGAIFGGGDVAASGGSNLTITNSIIANNQADNGGNNWNIKKNCPGQYNDGGNNLQYPAKNPNDASDKNCTGTITIADPKLGPLSYNRGPTKTIALLPASPAIDTANNATCPTTDQRGTARRDGNGDSVITCDIGAFEYVANPSIVVTSTSDDGTGKPGTLSQAINQASTDPAILSIILSPRNIAVNGKLPALPGGVTLDGGAASCNNKVILDGTNAPADAMGLTLSGGNVLRALNVTHFKKAQIQARGNGNSFICVKASQ